MGQTTSVIPRLFNEDSVLNLDCYDGYLKYTDTVLGEQLYLSLRPGCSASIDGVVKFNKGMIFMISVDKNSDPSEWVPLRLHYNGQSISNLGPDQVYIVTIIDGIPAVPSLAQLSELRNQSNTVSESQTSTDAIQRVLKLIRNNSHGRVSTSTNVVAKEFPNNGTIDYRRVGYRVPQVGCPCKK